MASEKTFSQAEVDAIIADRLARLATKHADYDAMAAELATLKAGTAAETEAAQARLAAAETRLHESQGKLAAVEIRALKVAALEAEGLSPAWASRLVGEDVLTFESDARALKSLLGSKPGVQSEQAVMNSLMRGR